MSEMKPKHLKPEMALAVLRDLKTMTRMPLNPQPIYHNDPKCNPEYNMEWRGFVWSKGVMPVPAGMLEFAKYKIGDVLYIRERARLIKQEPSRIFKNRNMFQFKYESDGTASDYMYWPDRIKPIKLGHCVPNGCFRELARIFVKITGVRVEWSEDMSLDDIIAEGVQYDNDQGRGHLREKWDNLWNSCYPELMGDPHWRFAYTFERINKP
jgi:hypothetical protein